MMRSRRSTLSNLHEWNFKLCGVIAGFEALTLCEDAQHGWVSIRHPSPEDESTNEDHDPGEQTFEKVEHPDRPDADKVKDGPLNAQVCEWLVEALKNSIPALEVHFLHDRVLSMLTWKKMEYLAQWQR
jgi:hypothetical protein